MDSSVPRSLRRSFRKMNRFSRNLFLLFVVTLFLAIAAWESYYIFFHTGYFFLSRIEISGNNRLDADEIRRISGLVLKQSVFGVDLDSARSRLREIPLVDRVQIHRDGLDTVRIQIRERVPVALVLLRGIFYEIDRGAVLIAPLPAAVRVDLPLITGIELAEFRPGQRLEDRRVQEAVRWLTALGPEYLVRVSEIHFEQSVMSLRLVSGETVLPGTAENFRELYDLMLASLEKFRRQNMRLAYLDMRFNREIVVRPENL